MKATPEHLPDVDVAAAGGWTDASTVTFSLPAGGLGHDVRCGFSDKGAGGGPP